MANRRDSIHEFYRSVPGGGLLLEKAAASSIFAYHGPALEYSIVTRSDLTATQPGPATGIPRIGP